MNYILAIEPMIGPYAYMGEKSEFISDKTKAKLFLTKEDAIFELFSVNHLFVKMNNDFYLIDDYGEERIPQSFYDFKDKLIDIKTNFFIKYNKHLTYNNSVSLVNQMSLDFCSMRPKYILITEDGDISFADTVDEIMLRILNTTIIKVPDFS